MSELMWGSFIWRWLWGKEWRPFSNDGQGHEQLVNWLGQMAEPWQVICEGSGGYEVRWCATWRQVE